MNTRNIETVKALNSLCQRIDQDTSWVYNEANKEYQYRFSNPSYRILSQPMVMGRVALVQRYTGIQGTPVRLYQEDKNDADFVLFKYPEEQVLQSTKVSQKVEELRAKAIADQIVLRDDVSKENKIKALVRALNKLCQGLKEQNRELTSIRWYSKNNQIYINYTVNPQVANEQVFQNILGRIGVHAYLETPWCSDGKVEMIFPEEHLLQSLPVVTEYQKELDKKPSNILPLVTGIAGGVMLGIGIATGGLALAIAGGIVMLGSFIKAIWNCCAGPSPARSGVFRSPVEGVDDPRSSVNRSDGFSPAPA